MHVLKTSRRGATGRLGLSQTAVISTLIVAAVTAGALWYYTNGSSNGRDPSRSAITATVSHGTFRHSIVERGEIESSHNIEVRCEVKSSSSSPTTILWIIEEGKMVQAGEKLVEFNAAPLRELETQQQIVFEQARAAVIQAQLAFESAQIAIREYENGTFPQELKAAEAEIVLARENLRRAESYAAHSERLARKGYISQSELEADQFSIVNATLSLEAAETLRRVLSDYTQEKMIKMLRSEAGMAESQWRAEQAKLELERAKLADLQEQISKCVIHSPTSGQVVYGNDVDRRGNVEQTIFEGATVRERQIIIRLPDPSSMQVRARVKEGKIGLVRAGQRAEVRIDALKGLTLSGEVLRVDPIAVSSWGTSVKEYTTYVAINNPPQDLKPGMTASVEVVVDVQRDVLTVPVQTVSRRNGQHYVCLRTADGPEARVVEVGATNGSQVIVTSGLKEDEVIVMDPDPILAELVPIDRTLEDRPGRGQPSQDESGQVARGNGQDDAQGQRPANRGPRPGRDL